MKNNTKTKDINSKDNLYEVITIGAGPAGLTSALYLARAGAKQIIIEKYIPGGKLTKTAFIENYSGFEKINGTDLAFKMYNQILKYKVVFKFETVINIIKLKSKIFKIITNKNTYFSKAVIIATGTKEREVGAINENTFYNKGVSYCAVCDGSIYKNRPVAVVGGGMSAVEESMYLTRFVKEVHLIHRRDIFRVPPNILAKARENKKIKWYLFHIWKEARGDDVLKEIVILDLKKNQEKILKVDAIFPYIGSDPIIPFQTNFPILGANNYLKNNQYCETAEPGIFAAGDVTKTPLRQVATAVSDGAKAAQFAMSYIDNLQIKDNNNDL